MSSAAAAALKAFGLDRGLPFPIDDIATASVILLVGANPAETMPPIMQYFEAQQRAGGRLIVVDPRRTATAAWAGRHLRLTPGTDAALANGLLHILLRDGLVDTAYVGDRTEGFEDARRVAMTYWPERVERVTGIAEHLLIDTAHQLARARNVADPDGARSGAADPGREQHARLHQRRAGARRGGPAVERVRDADRTGQRPGRPRARSEGRPAARLPPHRRPGGQASHRRGLERRRAARSRTPASQRSRCSTRSGAEVKGAVRHGLQPRRLGAGHEPDHRPPRRPRHAGGLRLLPV